MRLCLRGNLNEIKFLIFKKPHTFFYILKTFTVVLLIFYLMFSQTSFVSAHTLSITSSGAQNIDVSGLDSGTAIGVDNIAVSTSCRYGYNFTLSTSVNNNNLYLNGDSSNNTSNTYFTPADGATALSNSSNRWGYYYDDVAPTTPPTASNIFSAIPALGSTPATIKSSLTTPSASDINDTFNIYYGVSSSSNLVPGTYRMIPDTNNNNNAGTIIYRATMAENCIPYTIQFNPTSTASGASISGTGTMSPQEVYPSDTITLSPMSFTPPSGYEFMGWNTAQDGSGDYYEDEAEVTGLVSGGGTITLYAQWYIPPYLYNAVANLVKTSNGSSRTQTLADMQAVITKPTSSDPATDTSNSGVFLYDATTFGTASDASNDYPIYYYRGILDSNLGNNYNTNGSTGDGAYYPNYVKLNNNTCWRIVRTTGSGGVKMVYNGLYGDSTTGSCANSATNATTKTTITFSSSSTRRQYTGYTYNPNPSGNGWVSVDTVYGNDANYSTTNTTDSTIKDYLENTWYVNNMADYTDILEPSAGYCNERVFYTESGNIITTAIPDSIYTTGEDFGGSSLRNLKSGGMLTLACQRQTVDLYTTPAANNGNKQLKYPIALLTADELALSGSGKSNNQEPTEVTSFSSNYSYSSYLESYSALSWLMSPDDRDGTMTMGYGLSGAMVSYNQSYARPTISLIHDIFIVSGNGTANNPWIISTEKPKPSRTINLYNAVEKQSKGTQTLSNLQSTISTSNSGVYEYDSSVFGADTDGVKQDNTKAKIYYYRGILDNSFTTSTYGSSGDGELSPNYVILSPTGEKGTTDTCWRIIRTTGSGGVKMIYNGRWTGSTCANAQTNAQTGTSYYNSNGSTAARRIALAGYTYNSYGSSSSTTNTAVDTLFGSNTNYSGNTNNSVIKSNVDSWYNNNLSNYTSILESNPGFCNDRSVYTNTAGTTAATQLRPTGSTTSSGTTAYFGAYSRNNYNSSTRIPSLACPRNAADVYSTSTASAGNKQLSVPAALITADELSFAGAGAQTANQGSAYSTSSFIRSGSDFWTMTPSSRTTSNNRATLMYYSSGANTYLSSISMYSNYGVRPVISLKEGAEAKSGTGTATDPWVIEAP